MRGSSPSLAWLARPGGSVVVGHGPFVPAASPPLDGTAFFVQDFGLADPLPWKIPARVEEVTAEDFRARHAAVAAPACVWETPDAVPFAGVFQKVMAAIQAGNIEKTVPVVVEEGTCDGDPGPGIMAAMARQGEPFLSYAWAGPRDGFAGATPETLVCLQGSRLETMALAGTARQDDREVFAVDEKEIREHEYVAQTLVSKLTDLGRLHRHPRAILELGSIVHFQTLIEVELDERPCPAALVRRLHPTPALGSHPHTASTLEMLVAWRRRLHCPPPFGAPFGVTHGGRFDCVVAIRGIWWRGDRLALPAGCGIIEASRLVNEWRELRLKRESVKRFLA